MDYIRVIINLVFVAGLGFLWLPIATKIDAKKYNDPKTRNQVTFNQEEIRPADVYTEFLKINAWELGLFLAGLISGAVVALI